MWGIKAQTSFSDAAFANSAISYLTVFEGMHAKTATHYEEVDYTVVLGDKEIADGGQLTIKPGHPHGMQGVLVEGSQNRYFIDGDTFDLFRNLEGDPPLISGVYIDMRKHYETLQKILKLSAFILPGHDFKVYERKEYV